MRTGKLKGWNRGSMPQRLGNSNKCNLIRQGRGFQCTDLSLPPEQICSYCQHQQGEAVDLTTVEGVVESGLQQQISGGEPAIGVTDIYADGTIQDRGTWHAVTGEKFS